MIINTPYFNIEFDHSAGYYCIVFIQGENSVKYFLNELELEEFIGKINLEVRDKIFEIKATNLRNLSLQIVAQDLREDKKYQIWKNRTLNPLKEKHTPKASVIIYVHDKVVELLDAESITNSCYEFMEVLGFEIEVENEPIFGSFWKRMKFVFSSQITINDFESLLEKGKRALELKHVDLPTADQTEKLANSAEKIISSIEKFEEAVVKLGAILVLKVKIKDESKIYIQQLNFELIQLLDDNPKLIQNPHDLHHLLLNYNKKIPL